MKNFRAALAVLGFCVVGSQAYALVNVELDNNLLTLAKPATGSVDYVVTGSIDLNDGWTWSSMSIWFPSNGVDYLPCHFDAGLTGWAGTGHYAGGLFDITVSSTNTAGVYDQNASAPQGMPEFSVTAGKNGRTYTDGEVYQVTLVDAPVPEPASLAVLGIAAVALLRRRR